MGITPKLKTGTGLLGYQTFTNVYPKAVGSTAHFDLFNANNYNYNPTGPLAVNPANLSMYGRDRVHPTALTRPWAFGVSPTVSPYPQILDFNPLPAVNRRIVHPVLNTALAAKYVNKADLFNKPLPSARYARGFEY